jgi:hypothetical protein
MINYSGFDFANGVWDPGFAYTGSNARPATSAPAKAVPAKPLAASGGMHVGQGVVLSGRAAPRPAAQSAQRPFFP